MNGLIVSMVIIKVIIDVALFDTVYEFVKDKLFKLFVITFDVDIDHDYKNS